MIQITELERLACYLLVSRPGLWGGSTAILLAQDDLYRLLQLERFETQQGEAQLAGFQGPDLEVDLPAPIRSMLFDLLGQPGQGLPLARHAASLARKLKP